MHSNITMAVVLAVLASVAFAASSVVQHLAVADESTEEREALGGRQLLAVVKNPVWLAGLALLGLSAVGQVAALQLAPVTVVQPLGALAVPWTILLSARVHRNTVSRGMWTGTAMTLIGTVAVAWVAIAHATDAPVLRADRLVIGPLVCFAIALGLALVGAKGPLAWRCLAWALAASVIYGMESGLAKAIGAYLASQSWQGSATFWFMVASIVVGIALAGVWIQQGYAAGAAEIVVGGLNAGAPIAGVVFGIAVLGEGALLRGDTVAITLMLVFAAVALTGVVLLSRHHPGAPAT
ncbi:DMT family transporter [Propionicimonas sp.]|uniref:DMT family transporter n=1 Tax=Propionicimonas sp. TaxID=1955623 RepID=UPI0039E39C0B